MTLETIDILLEQNSKNSEENNINNAIKTVYYKNKKKEEQILIENIDKKINSLYKETNKEIDFLSPKFFQLTVLSLPNKIKLLSMFHDQIAYTTAAIEAKKSKCFNNFWNKYSFIFLLEFAYSAIQYTTPQLSSNLIYCVAITRMMAIIITLGTIGNNHAQSKFIFMFPFYQLYALYILTKIHLIDLNNNETNETNNTIHDLKNFTQKKITLEKEKQKLEDIVKNEYSSKNNKK